METFVLAADRLHGVRKFNLDDFIAENPDQDFVDAEVFIDYLDHLDVGESVAAIFHPLAHRDDYEVINHRYGIDAD